MTGIFMFAARTTAILTIAAIACFTYLACGQASKHPPLYAFVAVGSVVILGMLDITQSSLVYHADFNDSGLG
jgi:hypothetical protein